MRAAIYARMSTDKQSADSPADQIARCREFAERKGWEVVPDLIAQDAGISGASRHNRPELLHLVARIDEWDVLLCWDSSRLARDSEDLGWIRNRLRLHRRTAYEVSTGLDLENVGSKVMGIMNEEYLVKLRADTRRGLLGRAERGLATGGLPYGYRTEPLASDGSVPGARIVVEPDAAAVVRRLFNLYLKGEGLRGIAHRLNGEGVAPPRPRRNTGRTPSWTVSSIRSMLLNPMYRGEYVYNRSEWVKDHETGKRRRLERPKSEWLRQRDEAWRIVSDNDWHAVGRAMAQRGGTYKRDARGRLRGARPGTGHRVPTRYPLSGLLECGKCGGGFFVLKANGLYGCGWHRDRGPEVCSSGTLIPRQDLEGRVFGAIGNEVLTPENAAYVVDEALRVVRDHFALADDGVARKRLAELQREQDRAARLAVKTGGLDATASLLAELEAERRELEGQLREAEVRPDFDLIRAWMVERIADVGRLFRESPAESQGVLRTLLAGRRIRVTPHSEAGFAVDGLLTVPLNDEPPETSKDSGRFASVVAGEGFEPPTSGL